MTTRLSLLTLACCALPISGQGLGPNQTVPEVTLGTTEEGPAVRPWRGSVQVGSSSTSGNTRTSSVSVSAEAEKRAGRNRYNGKATYNFTEDREDDSTTEDNRTLRLEYNRFATDDFYWLAGGAYAADEVEGLEARLLVGAGAGYEFYEREDLSLNVELGVASVSEDYVLDVSDADYAAGRVASSLGWDINEKVRYAHDVELFQSLEEADDVIVTNDSRFELSLGKSMVATLRYFLDYDNTPAAGSERADHRLALTVGWAF